MLSLPRKKLCAPIYREPHEMREAVLKQLKLLENLQSVPWISPSSIFLNGDGDFSLQERDEGSLKVRMQSKFLSMVSLFYSPSLNISEKHQRLHYAKRRLLISLVAYAWLWGRPKVLDSQGNPVTYQERIVLAPEDIFTFLRDTRVHKEDCPCGDLGGFLKTVRVVPLIEETSEWNVMGITACLWWDRLHDSEEHIWCTCRIIGATDRLPESLPPYDEANLPTYH